MVTSGKVDVSDIDAVERMVTSGKLEVSDSEGDNVLFME